VFTGVTFLLSLVYKGIDSSKKKNQKNKGKKDPEGNRIFKLNSEQYNEA